MDLGLAGKSAIVTGGSRGIGRAIAKALLEEAVRVIVAARDPEAVAAAAEALATETGGEVHGVAADTGSDAQVDALVARAVELFGGVDILVNAAAKPGTPTAPGLAGAGPAYVLGEIDAKVIGYLRTARAVAPHQIARGWGRIINIGGLAARQAGLLAGSIRNVSVAALSKALADELGPQGINVTVVHPGATRTPAVEAAIAAQIAKTGADEAEAAKQVFGVSSIGRIVEAEEVAAVVAFLASPKSVAINGDAIAVGGGTPRAIHY